MSNSAKTDPAADRNLLFGVLALQADLLDAHRFAEACTAWSTRKDKPLADLVVERGWLTPADRDDVEKLLQRKLKKNGGDVRASLAEVVSDPIRQTLTGIADPVIQHNLSAVPRPETDAHEQVTVDYQPPAGRERYTLNRLQAKGGIGQVWLARDGDLGREVALKELLGSGADSPAVVARFVEEAQITGQLQHPNIVPVYELARPAEKGKGPFYTMRFVRGRTLAAAIKQYHEKRRANGAGPLELRELLSHFVAVCNAVAYAHSRGVLHRDLKPGNVVLGDFGEVIVLDWGLAKLKSAAESQTSLLPVSVNKESSRNETVQGQALGTPSYMPPEQAEGRLDRVDERSDVYGLGAVLYETLTGAPPFEGPDTASILAQVVIDAPVPPRQKVKATPRALQAVCLQALAKKPADRYASAKELAQDVGRWLGDEPVSAYREPLLVRAGRWQRRHRQLLTGMAALLLAAVPLSLLLAASRQSALRQAAARRADADATASVALGRAEVLASQAGELDPRTPQEAAEAVAVWEQAEAAVAQAEAPAAACSAEVARQVAQRAAAVRHGLERARRDAALLQGLAAVRTTPEEQKAGNGDLANKVRAFRSALAAAGLPARLAGAQDVPAAVAAIQGERPGARTALRSAIDLLLTALPRAGYHADFEFAAWLEAADRCDDNPFRREVRGKLLQGEIEWLIRKGRPISPLAPSRAEPPVGLPDLLRLAERAEAEESPGDAVIMLSTVIEWLDGGSNARLLRLLQVARDRRPNDPELLLAFAQNMRSVFEATREPRAFAEALAGFRACIALRPDEANAYHGLGYLLDFQGDHAGAVAAYRAAIARNPRLNFARINLAIALENLGDLDGAIAVLRETVRLDPNFAKAHNNLGETLQRKGDLDGAIAEYKEVLRLNPKDANAVANLPEAERMREVLLRLPRVLAGTDRPASPAEALSLAALCCQPFQRRYAAAVRLSEEAFAADPGLMFPDSNTNRYNAACSAALAGGGGGVDAPSDAAGRAALRAKALAWLRADLGMRQGQAASAKPANWQKAADVLDHWLTDADLAGVRDPGPLAKLPAAERPEWEKLWQDVKATLADARKPAPPAATNAGKK
jgi:tetratricopeptide (TPR) repeat protein/tRNA A-37 threonylcarbamoyl transferase component Bud32